MTLEQLQTVYNAQPFRPFSLHLADGRQIDVKSREYIMAAPTGRTVAVWQENAFHIVDLLLVTDIEIPDRSDGGKRKRRA